MTMYMKQTDALQNNKMGIEAKVGILLDPFEKVDTELTHYIIADQGLRNTLHVMAEGLTQSVIHVHLPGRNNEKIPWLSTANAPFTLLEIHNRMRIKATMPGAGGSPDTGGV